MTTTKRILLSVSMLCLAVHLYVIICEIMQPVLVLPIFAHALEIDTVILTLFSLCHATYMLGVRRALAFFLISAIVSWIFEQVGVTTGLIYGSYHYTNLLGPKLGAVPVLIPLAWFMMIYPSYVIANVITTGSPVVKNVRLSSIFWLSLISAMVMTAWDLAMDPMMTASGHWVWESGGAYFGVPLQNYAGWLLTTFVVYFIYRFSESHIGSRPPVQTGIVATVLPIMAYAAFAMVYAIRISPEALRLIVVFAMGFPVLTAILRLLKVDSGLQRLS